MRPSHETNESGINNASGSGEARADARSEGWPLAPSTPKAKLDKLLVVIDSDLTEVPATARSPLLKRAVQLARASGCELELLHVCCDETLNGGLFAADDEVTLRKLAIVDQQATRLAELSAWLKTNEGVEARIEARWDSPRADAILRRIHEVDPDLVMKTSSQSDYLIGLLTNTDWELIRNSPAHLWFVPEGDASADASSVRRMITALGSEAGSEVPLSIGDYDVCEFANLLSDRLGAENTVLHTYQVPRGLAGYSMYSPVLGGLPVAAGKMEAEQRQSLAVAHGEAVEAFAEYFGMDLDRIQVVEGRLSELATELAGRLSASLIVMGARDLGRLERLVKPVNAEPVLARAPCDVVFVREQGESEAPAADQQPAHGLPRLDLARAILDPRAVFGTPQRILEAPTISTELRVRLLEIWENDLLGEMTEEDEGGPVRSSRAGQLDAIRRARKDLAAAGATPAQPEFA